MPSCDCESISRSENSSVVIAFEELGEPGICTIMRKRQVVLRREEPPINSTNSATTVRSVRYGECQKNHAAGVGGYALDGCREFMATGEEGTDEALICAACGCHRNFHRREVNTEIVSECDSAS